MSEPAKISLLVVDDHPLMREGVSKVINDQPDMHVVAQAAKGGEALALYRQHRPAITLLDLRLPDIGGIEVLAAIRAEDPQANVIIFTTAEGDVDIQRCLRGGAHGYVLKSTLPHELTAIIRQAHQGRRCIPADVAAQLAHYTGESGLTAREIEVLCKVARGHRNKDIAGQLFISEETVKAHMKHILDKLGASGRSEAVAIAVRRGIMQL
ncbi:LuxR family transcriptional regulator [Massilia sp. Root351]|jgi:DNA-binding NarL/FixJ family response regulator|uniref:response regulator n=1 Tax=Massilia sp. Root351 TaxID=1736522 RepID=UPI00070D17AD|nr:response regulator transcription factor [Massilia sp. Root351]KQV90607.1 LuxR family transcriptional regulator [Massilia sp. Root351]